jgi:hypothetical protein
MFFTLKPAGAEPIAVILALLAPVALAPSAARADDGSQLAIHGFGNFELSNDYLTPRGLLVVDKGTTIQVVDGLVFDFYQAPSSTVNDIALVAGTFNDIDTDQHAANVGSWNEFDWFIGPDFKIGSNLDLSVQYLQFLSPPGHFTTEQNLETALKYSDNLTPTFSINPYAKFFYAISGDSTVVTGAHGDTFDVELGAVPKVAVDQVTVTFPTWITVGPSDYWGGSGNFGVFTTGIKASVPLNFIPPQLGHWEAHANIQYYNEINDELIKAQELIGTGPDRNIFVFRAGFGFGF